MRRFGWLLLVVLAIAGVMLAGCGGDDNGNGGPVNGTFDAASWDGTWDGQWVNQTFNSTGGATFDVDVNVATQTIAVTADLDGAVFGQADPPPINMSLQYTDSGVSATVNGTQLGDLAFTIDESGNVQGSFTNVPGGGIARVDFTGQRVGNTLTINYTVQFSGGGNPATGVLTVNLQ